jgi:hypothetical protein
MKYAVSLFLSFLACCAVFFPFLAQPSIVSAMPAQSMAAGANFNCSSEDGGRKFCPTNTSGGVQLVYQRSGSPCEFGRTWGYDERGVWVDRGCRADFAVGYTGGPGGPNWQGWGQSYNVYCASDDMGRNYCPVDTRGGVRLVRKRSDSDCVFGRTWGYERRGIWVDRGCRADFEIGQAGWQPSPSQTIYCASDDMRRNVCRANTRGGVRIIRQRSESDCIYGRTWGYDHHTIWVDRGCRADFAIGGKW